MSNKNISSRSLILKKVFLLLMLCVISLAGCMTHISQESLTFAKENNLPLLVTSVHNSFPNNIGGVDISIEFINTSSKPLKYVLIDVQAYNKVEDLVPCGTRSKRTARLKDTGPINPGGKGGGRWTNIWYNYSISYTDIVGITVIYMDDSTEFFGKDDLSKIVLSNPKKEKYQL